MLHYESYPEVITMSSRITARRILLLSGGATVCVLIFLYMGVQAFLNDHLSIPEADLSSDSSLAFIESDSVTQDTVPGEFAALLNYTNSIDTTAGPAGTFIIDTSYVANPRGVRMEGRKVSLAVCGVDSRAGERVEHADANHVITVWLDSGWVDITSIPRDTPCDAGFPGKSRLNNLSNLRARKGRDAYLREVAMIAGLDTIEYYIDLGFSQARGVLELLGFKENSADALRVLRSRRIFASGDFQRSFNQGQFMRQMLLKQFGRLEGISGNLLMRAGLYMVGTNLTIDDAERIAGELRAKGFPGNPDDVTVCIRPAYYAKMAVFNFNDSAAFGGLVRKTNEKIAVRGKGKSGRNGGVDSTMIRFHACLIHMLSKAAADSAKVPVRVIANLRRPFEQRIWWQIADKNERGRIRRELGALLAAAYTRTGRPDDASRVNEVVRFEEELFAASQGVHH